MNSRILSALLFVVLGAPALAQDNPLPPINYVEYHLKNGLRVILHEDHSTPIVAVNIWYHVGSKNEAPGKTGLAHLFEHMMFQGSRSYDDDYFKPLQEAGGSVSASTDYDRTNYWETVPSNFVQLALFLEADRMGGLLDSMTGDKLDNQREIVKNEKRQRFDNVPYGQVQGKVAETLYPPGHPYHGLPIGSMEDLTRASLADIRDFFRRFYTPNNASLAIAGDFDPGEVRRLVQKYFGAIPRGPRIRPIRTRQPALAKEVRVSMEDRVSLSRVYLEWHTVPAWSSDEPALDILANILSSGKSSRLYRRLVHERQITQSLSVLHKARQIAGTFEIGVTAKGGAALLDIEKAVDAEIGRIRNDPPSVQEVERAYNALEASFLYGLQAVGGLGSKSDQLNLYATFRGNPGLFNQDLARYRRVTPRDVQRVARHYLTDKRLIVTVVPGSATRNPPEGPAKPQANAPSPAPEPRQSTATPLPKPKADPKLTLPVVQRRKLANGLEVLIAEHHELPVISFNLIVKNGAAADPVGRAGLAILTADLLDEGTETRSAFDLSDQLATIGARLSSVASRESNHVSLITLSRHLDRALDIYSDVVMNPLFPSSELVRIRQQRLGVLRQRRDNATSLATELFPKIIYGSEHPYGHSIEGDQESLTAITRAEVVKFHADAYRPNGATLIVVGDVAPDDMMQKLEKSFGRWLSSDSLPTAEIAVPPQRDRTAIYLVDKPGAAQSVIIIGGIGPPRSTSDYFPLLAMTTMLGGQFTSRINMNLRESKGYTYGARTAFDYANESSLFSVTLAVQTPVTKESVAEIVKELRGIRGAIPVTDQEVQYSKQNLIRAFPRGFETPEQIAQRLTEVVIYRLPDTYFNDYLANLQRVTKEDVIRVANQYLDPTRMAIVIVGDIKVIEPALRSLDDIGSTITILGVDGKRADIPSGSDSNDGR